MIEPYNDITQKALFMGKWLWILFWMIIPASLADIMTINLVALRFPLLYMVGLILKFTCSIGYGLIILKMSSENGRYRKSGLCYLIAAAINTIAFLTPGKGIEVLLILTLPATVIALFAKYHEFMSHAEVVYDVDADLTAKWIMLWKWYIRILCIMIGGSIAGVITRFLSLLVILAGSIGLIVVSILQLVYLYKSAKAFREYT
ncbi:MAG: hypothetical protein J1E65_02465 [Lachnospiraceae bacterium]|nr:hypothetical protein [Lachnospiraceae bacterium]